MISKNNYDHQFLSSVNVSLYSVSNKNSLKFKSCHCNQTIHQINLSGLIVLRDSAWHVNHFWMNAIIITNYVQSSELSILYYQLCIPNLIKKKVDQKKFLVISFLTVFVNLMTMTYIFPNQLIEIKLLWFVGNLLNL